MILEGKQDCSLSSLSMAYSLGERVKNLLSLSFAHLLLAFFLQQRDLWSRCDPQSPSQNGQPGSARLLISQRRACGEENKKILPRSLLLPT